MSREPPSGLDDRTVIRSASTLATPLERSAPPVDPTVIAGAFGGWSEPTVIAGAMPAAQPPSAAVLEEVFAAPAGLAAFPNPLMALSASVLLPLARLQAEPRAKFPEAALHARFAAALADFDRAAAAAGLPSEDARLARWSLAATIDDVVGHLPGIDPVAWRRQDGPGARPGDRHENRNFFDGLNRLLAEPQQRTDLVELLHACLALGFQGQYRGRPLADAELDRIRIDVHQVLRHLRPVTADLKLGTNSTSPPRRRVPPAAAALLVMGVVLAVAFGGMRYVLDKESDALEARLLSLSPSGPVTMAETPAAPPVESAPPAATAPPPDSADALLDRVRESLAEEINDGVVIVATTENGLTIEINNAPLFATGSATLKDEASPLARRLGPLLDDAGGPVRIIGYTDNVKPGRSSRFASNEALSAARAEAVTKVLAQHLDDASRLSFEGKGEADPIADNSTAEGRAKNRRVVILLSPEAAR